MYFGTHVPEIIGTFLSFFSAKIKALWNFFERYYQTLHPPQWNLDPPKLRSFGETNSFIHIHVFPLVYLTISAMEQALWCFLIIAVWIGKNIFFNLCFIISKWHIFVSWLCEIRDKSPVGYDQRFCLLCCFFNWFERGFLDHYLEQLWDQVQSL